MSARSRPPAPIAMTVARADRAMTVARADRAMTVARADRGRAAHQRGWTEEDLAALALERDGWTVHGRRLRTPAGEIDLVAEKDGLLAVVEVKARPSLARAAEALSAKQQARLVTAADILLTEHPEWGANGVRFDLLLVDAAGTVRRIADAFRGDG